MSVSESWCIFTFCPRKGPVRGDPNQNYCICEKHWKIIHEGESGKLEAVREFVLGRREDIELDNENLGMLKPVLAHFLEEAE